MLKNLIITFGLSIVILALGLFVFMPKSEAQSSILPRLLDIPAPPPPNPLVKYSVYGERPAEFYRKDSPPPDDAPIEDLLDYWKVQKSRTPLEYTIDPSPRVMDRLLNELENKPELVNEFLGMLNQRPEAADVIKRIYDRAQSDEDSSKYQTSALKNWLLYNSNYFSDDLFQIAQQVHDEGEYLTNHEDVLALARVDWDRAQPLLDRLLNDSSQPISRTLANWAYYLHALSRGNSIEAGNYREALMRVVEDKSAMPGNRDLAMDALVYGGDFPGRDDWYFTLMEDETLHDLRVNGSSYTGLTTLLMRSPPDKYVDKMVELVRSSNSKVRSAAIRNLMTVLKDNDQEKVKAVLTALLPWLENPEWAKQIANERRQIVEGLARVEIPESVPGLISVLNEKTIIDVNADADTVDFGIDLPPSPKPTPAPNSNSAGAVAKRAEQREVYPYRDAAIRALIMQKNVQAAAALRQVLPEVEPWQRDEVIKAILVSGGFTIPEQTEGLELFAKMTREQQIVNEKRMELANAANSGDLDFSDFEIRADAIAKIGMSSNSMVRRVSSTIDPSEIKLMLGGQVATIGEPGGELVSAVLYRIGALEKSDPPIAEVIRAFMQNWRGDAVNAILLDDLGAGKSTLDAIIKLLSIRKELRQNQIPNIYDARAKGNPIAYGISACLLEDSRDFDAIISNGSDDVRVAMLGCARLIRAPLPIQNVAPFLKSTNKLLALAAERYIESEDSIPARQIIYALYPNEAKITGAKLFFGDPNKVFVSSNFLSNLYVSVTGIASIPPYFSYMMFNADAQTEERLKKEVKDDATLQGIYAYDKNYVRIYPDKAIFSWEEDDARYRERKLNDSEFSYLKSYLTSNDVSNLPPFVSYCGGCTGKELLMIGRQGGRRVFLFSNPTPQFFKGLDEIFSEMRRPQATLKYWLEKEIAGVQILFAQKEMEAKAVWKEGDDLRLLVNDVRLEEQTEKELAELYEADSENDNLSYEQTDSMNSKRRADRAFASYSWHQFVDGTLGGFVNQPLGVDFIKRPPVGLDIGEYSDDWSVSAGNVEVRMVNDELLKIVNGQTTKLKAGYYSNPVITDNGRWVLLSKYDYKTSEKTIVRINLQTNRETVVKIETKSRLSKLIAFVSSVKKILLATGNSLDYATDQIKRPTYLLLDPDSGVSQQVKGEFRPVSHQTFRTLQKTPVADEVWAAIPAESEKKTLVGRYNAKTFVFTSVMEVPQIAFDSMDMWVDEPKNTVFIVYNGQLLSIPLKKSAPEVAN